MQKVRSVFGSIIAKTSLILIVMSGIIAATITLSSAVFEETVTSLERLTKDRLTELETASEVLHYTDKLKSTLLKIVASTDPDMLRINGSDTDSYLKVLQQRISTHSGDDRAFLESLLKRVNENISQLKVAKLVEFEKASQFQERAATVRSLTVTVQDMLSNQRESKFRYLELSKRKTVEDVDETIRFLTDDLVPALALRYETAGDMNIASGIALTMTHTTEEALLEALRSSLGIYIDSLKNRIIALENESFASFDTTVLREAIKLFEFVGRSNAFIANIHRDEIAAIRTEASAKLSAQIEEFIVLMESESDAARTENNRSIKALVDGPINDIRRYSKLESAAWSFMNTVFEITLAPDLQVLSALLEKFDEQVLSLGRQSRLGSVVLQSMISEILSLGSADNGVAKDKENLLQAKFDADIAKDRAVSSVLAFGATVSRIEGRTRAAIYDEGQVVLDHAFIAMDQLTQIAWFAAVAVFAALMLTFLWILSPIQKLTKATESLASGNLHDNVMFTNKESEIGRMARALQVFRDGLIEKDRLQKLETEERQTRLAEQTLIVTTLADALNRLAEGDVNTLIETEFPGEYDRLRADFNKATSNLSEIAQKILGSGTSVNQSSREISKVSDQLARRTENSAATLAETAVAISQITDAVQSAARRAEKALDVVGAANESALEGMEVVGSTVAAMRKIERSSDEILKIIGVIDDIAFQTSLLALNASVEAARAGDAGRGFSVVASEVRGLAQRSSDAAKEINLLITDSSSQVQEGVKLVGKTETALNHISSAVKEVSNQAREIADSAKQQAVGVAEVNIAIDELDRDTQRNAAIFEETNAASANLNLEAENLAEAISGIRFRSSDEEQATPQEENRVRADGGLVAAEGEEFEAGSDLESDRCTGDADTRDVA